MEWISAIPGTLAKLLPVLVVLAIVGGTLALTNRVLKNRWRDQPDLQFRFQLIMLALTFAGILAVLLALPMSDSTRGQLLGLIGILLSAANPSFEITAGGRQQGGPRRFLHS